MCVKHTFACLYSQITVIFLENPKGLAKEILRLVCDSTRTQDLQGPSYKKINWISINFTKRNGTKI